MLMALKVKTFLKMRQVINYKSMVLFSLIDSFTVNI